MTSDPSMPIRSVALPIYGFMHVATFGVWEEVVTELIAVIHNSGLYARTTQLSVGVVGPESGALDSRDKTQIVYRSPYIEEAEFPTLHRLYDFCVAREKAQQPALVYYVHTKGLFQNTPATTAWRKMMSYFVIEHHQACIAALAENDICGV